MATVLECENREDWLEARKGGIGGSDAPVVMGTCQYKSPYELWAEKTQKLEPLPVDSEPAEFGNKLEGIVLSTLAERTGRKVDHWPQDQIVRHSDPDLSFILCTPDGLQVDKERGRGIVQAKTASAFLADKWRDEPPLKYQVQIQHEMLVTGADWGTLCVLIGGQKFVWYDVERNEKFLDVLTQREKDFWNSVVMEVPPAVDGSQSCAATLARLHPDDNGEVVDLPGESLLWSERLLSAKDQIAELNRQIKGLEVAKKAEEARFKQAIGDNTFGMLPNGEIYSLKTTERKGYSVDPNKFRTLRKPKVKG